MNWAHFFHIYQPADQQPDILEAVVVASYRPLLEGFCRNENIRLTLNVTGALLELFDKHGYVDLIDMLRRLGREGRVEFTGSSKYHAFLPLLADDEIIRQISTNNETLAFYFGADFKPRGFFPPEMAYDPKLLPILEDFGFQWMLLDEIALGGGAPDYTKRYQIAGSNLQVYFRERRLSNLIMSAIVRSPESLLEATTDDRATGRYVVTAMDGETFGHHRPGLEKILFDMFATPDFQWRTISDLETMYTDVRETKLVPSTWASSQHDIERNVQFLSWHDPDNTIHTWQWELVNLALRVVNDTTRSQMDKALSSDHLWWASAKPWWSLEMIEQGAYLLLSIVRATPHADPEIIATAERLYEKIVSTAFQWQRTGRVRRMIQSQNNLQRIPFQDRTLAKGGAQEGVYHAFIAMMKDLEQKAAAAGEYEQAVLWRDAVYKLEHKQDIYDAISAIDLLRTKLPHELVEKTIEEYKEKYRHIRGGQPEQRGE